MGLLDPQALEYFGLLGQSMLAGQSPNAGVNIGNAMMYADTEMRRKAAERARLEEERQQAKMRDMAMQKALREQEAQDYMGRGIQQFMRPPQAATQQFGPGDMETPSQLTPASPGGFDQAGFAKYLAQNPATAQQALQFMPKPREPFKLNKNERLIDPTTNKPIVDAVEDGIKKGTTRVIESGRVKFTYEWDGGQWKQIAKSSMDKPEGEAKPHYDPTLGGYVYPPKNGQAPSFVPIPGAPKKPEKPLTEAQAKAAAFLGQMREANAVINNLNSAGFSGGGAQQIPLTMATSGMDANSITGKAMGALANATVGQTETGKQAQKYGQAQEQWAEAFLRFKTGAAATESEVRRNIRTFFPQPGDSDELIQQKESMRANAERDMSIAAGTGADKIPQPMTMRPQSAPQSSGWGMKRLE